MKGVVKLETLWWILTYGETSVPALALLSTVVWQMSRVNKEQLIANSVTRLFINYCTWRNTWFVCMWGINLICRNYVTRPFYQLHHLRKHMVCMHMRNKSHVCKVCDKIILSSTIPEETHCLYAYRKETSFIKISLTRFFYQLLKKPFQLLKYKTKLGKGGYIHKRLILSVLFTYDISCT